jgi:hypothetical protein
MRRLFALFAMMCLILGLTVSNAGSASALGGETFGCKVSPGTVLTYNTYCNNHTKIASSYQVGFVVQNETAPSTYSWSVPTAYASMISSGCTSTSSGCTLTIPNSDSYIAVSVTLTQDGASETLSAFASIARGCGNQFC